MPGRGFVLAPETGDIPAMDHHLGELGVARGLRCERSNYDNAH